MLLRLRSWLASLSTTGRPAGRPRRRRAAARLAWPAACERLETRCLLAASPLGATDVLISHTGPNGDASFVANTPAMAYNSQRNEYLVVWSGDEVVTGAAGDNQRFEIFGQRVNASTGEAIGDRLRISAMGTQDDPKADALTPSVTYNAKADEYLVVWSGDTGRSVDAGGPSDDEFEIWGQRITGSGVLVGATSFEISNMGGGNASYDAFHPSVAYNSASNEYLVVWYGDKTSITADNEYEIFGQRLSAGGVEVGTDDFRITNMGPTMDPTYDALDPSLVYNPTSNEYFVAWSGNSNTGGLTGSETEIWGQRLAANGTNLAASDIRISTAATETNALVAATPAVAYNNLSNEYLVAWSGDTLTAGEREIFVQRLNSNGTRPSGAVNTRISHMGTDGNTSYGAFNPAVAFNATNREYLVAWSGSTNTGNLVAGENEIFGQRLNTLAQQIGTTGFRISHMGTDGSPNYDASTPALAYAALSNKLPNQYLVTWSGDTNTGNLVDGENEIFGQRLGTAPILVTGADAPGGPHVQVFDSQTLTYKFSFMAYDPSFHGGVRVATGDVDGDGVADIITAPGSPGGADIRVFSGVTGGMIAEFAAYDNFFGGVYVAAADFNNDGRADIVTGPGAGGGPNVRIFDVASGGLMANFLAYDGNFFGGVRVATGDVNADGIPDLITGAGQGGGPHVKVFSGADLSGGTLLGSFMAYDPNYYGGVYVAGGNVNAASGIGPDEVVVGQGVGGYQARVFTGGGGLLATVNTFVADPSKSEVRVATGDVNADGRSDLILGTGPGDAATVRAVDFATLTDIKSFTTYGGFTGGMFVAGMGGGRTGSPERAAGGALADSDAPSLTQADLQPVVAAALSRYQQAGLSNAQLAQLTQVQFRVTNLGGDEVGLALPGTVLIDVNAAGHGWFVDRTPLSDEEFAAQAGSRNLSATARPAVGRMDLLTVVLHELGHELGLSDLDPTAASDNLMAANLPAGIRRLPAMYALDQAFADEQLHQALAIPSA